MVDLETFRALSNLELNDFSPKPTSIEGDQVEAARKLFEAPDGSLEIGIWECSPGRFTADRTASSETCYIITGRVEMRRNDGEIRELGPGDLLVLPRGWKGEWHLLERTRKLYIIHRNARKA